MYYFLLRNVICTIKLDNFLDNPLSYTHIMRELKNNVNMRERIVQEVIQFGCTNNIALFFLVKLYPLRNSQF
jgi:hypothetical protein